MTKILIVDADPEMLVFLAALLKGNTLYEVMATGNPLEALELIKATDIDLLITESKMPVVDGHELLAATMERDRDTPVIIISDYGAADSATDAMRKGGSALLMKPIRKDHLLFSVEKALSWAAVRRENRMLRKQLEDQSALMNAQEQAAR